ncbi:acyltransferase family protein [Rhizobium sp. C4]|uniref:acyltransferase family protein n=1 Tax=Rhizobium sp. C4 TaxID=1349800 RepID=UPI001E37C5AF|nr:acyltransferase family protein [Rhizobium sp. C4]MCD2173161.1 acyltransferase [Rhizobium sp. C4]
MPDAKGFGMALAGENSEVAHPAPADGEPVAHHLAYRPDIEGLRAIAVLTVVAAHLGLPFFRGGFVGVDVFFVISGYLITGILLREFEGPSRPGWLMRFYERRARRLFPAFFTVVLVTMLAATFVLFPSELAGLGRNALAAIFFSSNIYLYANTNYFAPGSDANAFLHTWSLAVEEQFYLFYPPLLFLLCRHARRILPTVLLAVTVGSFVLCVSMTAHSSQAAFYIFVFRAWELAAGACLAFVPRWRRDCRILREALAITGLLLIAASVHFYFSKMGYPGVWASAPVLGAVLIIFSGQQGPTLVSRLLSTLPMVFIGRISYSLYLWHWPIYVLVHLALGRALRLEEQLGLLALSIVVSAASWRFVEQPFRTRARETSSPRWAWAAGAGIAVSGAAALFLIVSGGMPWRFTPEVDRLARYAAYDDVPVYRRGTCFIDSYQEGAEAFDASTCLKIEPGKRNLLLIGDSHAAHVWKALEEGLPETHVLQATASGCKPFLISVGQEGCTAIMELAMRQFLPNHPVDGVIISAEWKAIDKPYLAEVLKYLKTRTPNVYLLGPIVEYNQSLARLLARAEAFGTERPGIAAQSGDARALDADLAAMAAETSVAYLSPYRTICPAPVHCLLDIQSVPIQWDNSHLTAEGAAYVITAFRRQNGFAPVRP